MDDCEVKKYYLIEEADLRRLIRSDIELLMLRADGVDSWEGYGESFEAVLREYTDAPDASWNDMVDIALEDYQAVFIQQ